MPACTAFGTKSRISVTFTGFASAPRAIAVCAPEEEPPIADRSAEPHAVNASASTPHAIAARNARVDDRLCAGSDAGMLTHSPSEEQAYGGERGEWTFATSYPLY